MVLFDCAVGKKRWKRAKKAVGAQAASSQGAKKMWEGDGFNVAFSFPLLQAAAQDVLDRGVLAWWFNPGAWGEQWEDPGNLVGKTGGEVLR